MKRTLTLLALGGLVALTGCSADDLAGPDTFAPGATDARFAPAPASPNLSGTWHASDAAGLFSLSLEQAAFPEVISNATRSVPLTGMAKVPGLLENGARSVALEGQRYLDGRVAFHLLSRNGDVLAKAEGAVNSTFTAMKVTMRFADGSVKELEFLRGASFSGQ